MPKTNECPEAKECLSLKGKPIGMYHCSYCGEMIIAGTDPTPECPKVKESLNAKD